ncbi:Putative hemagglutinin-related protein precursor [Flavobacterium indicum GPTSA100-9 = DSM 17447]|uniref:Putative hemagglutinin-related protein n=1 Tax=Flavobacterium indicum (strain DSM 17447 / CIP 109464 / GPTSA100-9) TaxID=1094466 RepID=H8XS67_FLAIG|nr:hypothetical protein [Flavobacterium indicum]CCG54651.1 Putative hemagglutinin-related protein precursor [Flavobacterium indicum GPTSA100-9 = DSM 17447]
MKKTIHLFITFFSLVISYGQVGIGTTNPHASSILELNSTSQGLLITRLTSAQRDAIISPANGLIIYNTSINCFQYYKNFSWFSLCDATVSSLNCGGGTASNGAVGVPYSGNATLPYLGGNGGSYSSGYPISSTGVSGLTATLQAGTLSNGAGNLTFTISGTPTSSGTANFAFSFGGQSCTFSITIDGPTIASIPCSAPFTITPAGNGIAGLPFNKIVSVPYTGGNGVAYSAGSPISSIGVTGLTATLNAGTLATGAGNFTFTVTGTPNPFVSASTTATATFPFTFDGKNCSFTVTINKASIAPITCSSAVVENPTTGSNGSPYVGTITITYPAGGNGGCFDEQTITSSTVTGLTAILPAGCTNTAGGTLVFNVSGTPTSVGNARFNLSNFITNLGCSGADVQITISGSPIVTGLNCSAATHSPSSATQLSAYSGTTTLPYTGGNGVAYPTQTIHSTGVTGLTAVLIPGTLASGNGNLTFTVTGTPITSGWATFTITFGGQTCAFSIRVNGRVITIDYIDNSSVGGAARRFPQQYVPGNYGPSGVFNTIGGISTSDFTTTFNGGISALTMKNTKDIVALGPHHVSAAARSVADCQRIRDYVSLGGIAIITLDAQSANSLTTANTIFAAFGGTGTFSSNTTTTYTAIPSLSSVFWGTSPSGVTLDSSGSANTVSAKLNAGYVLPPGSIVLARYADDTPAIWTCGEGNRALFICDDGICDSTLFTTVTVNNDFERFMHNMLKNYILVHLGF